VIDVCSEDERFQLAAFFQFYVDEGLNVDAAWEKACQGEYELERENDDERAEKFIEIMDRLIKEQMNHLENGAPMDTEEGPSNR
jgi:hypothetical protein